MKQLYSIIAGLFIFLSSLIVGNASYAQAVPDNVYYIPLPEQQLQAAFKILAVTNTISNTIAVNVSIVCTGDNAVIYYDHWEDGYQASYPGTRQSSTQVWGDNNPSNGIPPGYTTDVINSGDRINLTNNVVLPRNSNTIFYDGRDRIASTQFLSVTRVGVPTVPGSVLGSSVEVYDTTVYDREFQIPVGESTDQVSAGTTCCLFEYTGIYVMAREDNTTIQIDADGNGTTDYTATISQGESYSLGSATVGDVLSGARVTANKPIQVDLVTGDIGATYESRTFAMYPVVLWDNCYYNPVGQTNTNAEVAVFIYNPSTTSRITVNARTTTGVTSFTVGPKATVRYTMPYSASLASGAHFYTASESDKFFAVGAHDADATEQSTWDWGFSLLPEVFLTTAGVVGFGPGSSDLSANGSPVWVLATKATTIYADFDGDPTTGALTDPNGGKYDISFPVVADQSLRIFDNNDRDQTGMRVYTLDGTRIAIAWGEDAATAGPALPFLDLGTTVTPERKILIGKLATITVDNGQIGIIDPGDEITYRITIENQSLRTRNVVSVTDTIPAGLQYVAGSTRRNRTTVIPDQTAPNTAFPLDESGYTLGDLILAQKDTLSFRVIAQRSIVGNATVTNRVRYRDSRGDALQGQVTVNINQNFPPTANRNDTTTAFNTAVTIPILNNDVDRALRPASLTNVSAPTISVQPKNGTASINSSGVLTYTPNSTFAGRDTLIYRLCDNLNTNLCDTALVTIRVQSNPPVANPNSVTTTFSTGINIAVLGNDVDRAGRPAALTNVTALVVTSQPANGSVVVNANGSITYTPNNTFAGNDSFIYRICDNVDPTLCDTALVRIFIQSAPPIANPNSVTITFNTAIAIAILGNDVDKAGRPAALTNVSAPVVTSQPTNGTVAIVNGVATYTPNSTFAGNDSFIYRICDNVNPALCDTALVRIFIQSAPPIANPNSVTTTFNTDITIAVLGNDVDKAGRPAALTNVSAPVVTTQPANGTVVLNANGSITYRPNSTFAGNDSFIYRICDNVNASLCDTALVRIFIQSAPPVANPNTVTTAFNTAVTIPILGNDRDKAARPATLTNVTAPIITSQPTNGTVVVNADGSITYRPNATFAGTDVLIYRICDIVDPTLCDTALVRITIQSAPPVANPNSVTTAFNTDITIGVLGNDVDKAGRPAALTNVSAPVVIAGPSNGAAVVNADGSITYNPADTYAGNDTFIYRICDLTDPTQCDTALVRIFIQSAPPIANPDNVNLAFNQTVTIPVLGDDLDKAGRPASLTNVTPPVVTGQPTNGTVVVNAAGTINYTPNPGYAGPDSFIYRICDIVDPTQCDTALVVLNVGSSAPNASPDVSTTPFETPVTVSILGNDTDRAGNPATLTNVTAPVLISQPPNGTAVINADGTLTYTPDPTFAGTDTLRYRICDNVNTNLCDNALVTITVQSAPPVANRNDVTTAFQTNVTIPVLGNDLDKAGRPASLTNVTAPVITVQPRHGAASVNADGSVTYDPDQTFAGRDTLIYRICDVVDNSLCDTALVTITIQSAPPLATPNSVTTAFNTNISIAVLGNDLDKAGRPASLTNVSAPVVTGQPTNGTVVVNANGTITYNPNDTFAGTDSFIYRICDLVDPTQCDTALVTVTISSTAPVANPNSVTVAFNTNVAIVVLGNDLDKAGRPANLTNVTAPVVTSQPANGTVVVNSDGTITYNPADTFAGTDSFIYRICDNIDPTQCDTALVRILILSSPPVANPNSVTTAFNTDIVIAVLGNDLDKAGRPAALTNVSAPIVTNQPANGTVVVNADGTITYNPSDTFAGTDSFIYRICDNVDPTQCDTALVTITISSTAPIAIPNSVTTTFNTDITIAVLGNDVDKAGRPAALTNVSAPVVTGQPTNGTVVVNADGTITYNPADTFAGTDSFIYRICDNIDPTQCDTALVRIFIQSAPPIANPNSVTAAFNTNVAIVVLDNDLDKAGRPANLTTVSLPVVISQTTNGTVVVNSDGTTTYNPGDAFAGTDSFIYRICDLIDPTQCDTALVRIFIQSAPPIANPNSVTTAFNTDITIAVLGNDLDKAGRPASLANVSAPVVISQPANGTLLVNANGTITYNPDNTFAGTDSFIYRICDNIDPTKCDTALVTITIGSLPPVATNDVLTTPFTSSVVIAVLGNDVDKANRPASLTNVTAPVIINQPRNGTATVNADGTITYTPTSTFAGPDTLRYQICDIVSPALCTTALAIINVGSAPPVANRNDVTTAFNTNVTIPVLGNDLDKAGRPANLTNVSAPVIISQARNGMAMVNPDGSITYNPNDTYAGRDTLIYRICDIIDPAQCDTALVTILIQSVPPVANPDNVNLAFNQSVTVPVLNNDFDKANRPASLTNVTAPVIIGQPVNGTAVVNPDGTISYTPNNTFAGTDALTYRICDIVDPTQCTTAVVTFTVGSQAPNATSDVANTPFNQNVTIPILANDRDKAGQSAQVTNPATVTLPQIISGPANGTAIVNPDGTISYNPADTFAGVDSLRYRICDVVNTSLCATALVIINVGSAPPIANRNDVTTPFNTSIAISVLGNDVDKAARPASLTNVTIPIIVDPSTNGTAAINPDGTITYTPNTGFAGRDTLIYRICDVVDNSLCDTALVTIRILSAPPLAVNNTATTPFNTTVTVPILDNDRDRSGNPASLTNVTAPIITRQTTNGVAVVNADGSVTYKPNAGFAGRDTLFYRICDVVDPTLCSTARLVINVLSAPPVANDDQFSVGFNVTITVSVLGNDADKAGQPASLTNVTVPVIIQAPGNGAATVNVDGTISYNPNDTFAGRDTLFYQICDNFNPTLCDTARVIFNIGSAAPNANQDQVTTAFNTSVSIPVLSNDTDKASRQADLTDVTLPVITTQPRHGTAVVQADGSVTYTPANTFAGLDTLTYRICDIIDPTRCDTALVIINVLSAPPVANRNDVTTPFNTSIAITVLGNDVDKASRPASLTNVTAPAITRQPTNGQAVVNADGSITYKPNGTFAGLDSVIYQICDSFDPTKCDTALVTIRILSAPPIASNDPISIGFNQPVTIPVLANDADKAGRPANLTLVTAPVIIGQPANGSAVVNADGSITYNPADTFAGNDTLIYRICDVIDPTQCDTALVIIRVGSSAPNAMPDLANTAFNTNVVISVLANDTDKAGRPASLTNVTAPVIINQPTNGSAVVNADGTFTYNPADTFAGNDTLRYQICDVVNPALCDTALVVITVGSLPPVANPNSVTTPFNTSVVIAVLANDTDKVGQPASVTGTPGGNVIAPQVTVQPKNGTITLLTNGSLNYVPNRTFTGRDSLIYQICDVVDPTLCDTALVVITVLSEPPVANNDDVNLAFNATVTIPVLGNDIDKTGKPASLTSVTAPVIIGQPTNGTVVVNADGSITYNPNDTFAGNDTFTYRICDIDDPTLCDTAVVVLHVGSSAPNANPDVASTAFNTDVVINVLTNDTDKASLPASLTSVTPPVLLSQPANGSAIVNADGSITYNPADTFAGTDMFQYQICDVVDPTQCDTTTVMITVGSAPPVANRDDVVTNFNTTVSISVLANDVDKAGRPANANTPGATNVTIPVIITQAKNGVATVNDDGTISVVYNPNNTFAGRDSLVYQICDIVDPTLCDTALVTILIRSAAPVATNDQVNLSLGQSTTIPVLDNDVDKAGRPASLTNVTAPVLIGQPGNGSAVVNADGTISFTPSPGFAGRDTLIYQICDVVDPTLCDTARVIINIGSAPPNANQDIATTPFNTSVTVSVLGNDTDRAGRPASLTTVTAPVIISQPANGSAVANADGTIIYTPGTGFAGRDTLTYQICDVVNPALCDTAILVINVGSAAPVANPNSATATFNSSVTLVILANDVDKTGQPASLTGTAGGNVSTPVITQQGTHGQSVITANGSLIYTPNAGFAGRDTLIYRLCDVVDPALCDTALVVITVQSAPPVANPEQFNIAFNATVTVTVLNNDTDKAGFPASLSTVTAPVIVSQPKNGTAVVNPDGSITYDPADNFARQDTLTYRICDVIDPSLCDTTTVVFNVGSAAPNANQDNANTAFNTPVTIPVLANDTDKTSGQADLTDVSPPLIIRQPSNGTAIVNVDGSITYTPSPQFAGLDTLRYQICDLVNPTLCDTALVVINVSSAAPVANPDNATTAFNTPVSLTITANDLDKAGQAANPLANGNITLPLVTQQPAHGVATIDSTGRLTYTPNTGFAGQDTIIYRICDVTNNALCDTAQVIITVQPAIVASLGGFVFNDLNRNGAREPLEPGVAGVKVILYQQNGAATVKVDSLLSQADGSYVFTNLPSGTYQVQFVQGGNFTFTQANIGADDTLDSDAGPDGFSGLIPLDATGTGVARDNRTVFAGLIDATCPVQVCVPFVIQKTRSGR
jgi:hypothetical protein